MFIMIIGVIIEISILNELFCEILLMLKIREGLNYILGLDLMILKEK
jgi:hypothetical protein